MEQIQRNPREALSADATHEKIALKIVDRLDALVAYWDNNQICVFANDAYRVWVGRSREEMIGAHLDDVLGALYTPSLPYIVAAYEGQKQVFERDFTFADGSRHKTLVTYTPNIVEGTVHGMYVHIADIGLLKPPKLHAVHDLAQDDQADPASENPAPVPLATVGLLEDDEDQARLVSAILRSGGFAVEGFISLTDLSAREAVAKRCDVMILDWSLPDGTALEVLRAAPAANHRRVPLIILAADARESDVVAGLQAGADDYVVKPARPAELIARIRAALRRSAESQDTLDDMAPFSFDLDRHEIRIAGVAAGLTAREFAIAIFLFHRLGQAVTRKSIHSDVFKLGPQVLTRSLDTHVSRLRRKLELDGRHGFELVSIYQTGYRLRHC